MAPRTVAEVARAAFIAQLQAYRINLPGTLVGTDPIYLHDLRVANRRIRSGLTEFKGLFRPRDLDFFPDEFRWVQNETNLKRYLDVFLEQLPSLI